MKTYILRDPKSVEPQKAQFAPALAPARQRRVQKNMITANILRMATNALSREQGRMGEFVRRFNGRLGKAEGIVVGAHKLARIIWALIVSGQPYDEAKAFAITPASTARRLRNLQNQAKALNLTLVPA